ncbi:MAG TPA: methyltransferase domain-containing protein [Ktedonobacteraceae bacterium]|jgi:ubiquinone/menaquinone biosynthesis C-methylase UbiE|nr:methyltransferase domain-containing protein [Ktedonobacteraceae bacterium]
MAIENPVYGNECGLPLNAIEWLVTHHRSKLVEREEMIQDLHLEKGSRIVDAGCGPGLWTPLLARAVGPRGHIMGVDLSAEALVTARLRSQGEWYEHQISYKQGSMEHLPVSPGSIHTIFSANVSQYLPDPVGTFAALGQFLLPGGRLAIKDIDFGTMHFSCVDPELQARVFQARADWEQQRLLEDGYLFEDSWVGSKLAGYLLEAGYKDVQEKKYRIRRAAPLEANFRAYLQGIADWFVCEGAPFLSPIDKQRWLNCFEEGETCVFDQAAFVYEETEYMVTGIWPTSPARTHMDMHVALLETLHAGC